MKIGDQCYLAKLAQSEICRALKILDVSRNLLSSLPTAVWDIHSLVELHVQGNQIALLQGNIGQLTILKVSRRKVCLHVPISVLYLSS